MADHVLRADDVFRKDVLPTTTIDLKSRHTTDVGRATGQRPLCKNLFTMSKNLRSEERKLKAIFRAADGGGERDRTDDLLLAKQALSQLSYTPEKRGGPG